MNTNKLTNPISAIILLASLVFFRPVAAQMLALPTASTESSSEPYDEQALISLLIVLEDYDFYDRYYQSLLLGIERMAEIYKPDSLLLLTRAVELLENEHPFLKLYANKRTDKKGYSAWQPFASEQFEEYFAEQVTLYQKLEKAAADSDIILGRLYKASTFYLLNGAFEQARYFLNWIDKKYPQSYYVKNNLIAKRLRSLEFRPGENFPIDKLIYDDDREFKVCDSELNFIVYLDAYSPDYNRVSSSIASLLGQQTGLRYIILYNSPLVLQDLRSPSNPTGELPALIKATDELKYTLGFSDYCSNYLVNNEQKIVARDIPFKNLLNDPHIVKLVAKHHQDKADSARTNQQLD